MKKGGFGGSNTQTGIKFEGKVDLLVALNQLKGYEVNNGTISYMGHDVAKSYRKHALYTFLSSHGINYKDYISKKLLPDDAIYVMGDNTVYILEVKFQEGGGSVDEKIQTCDFKKKQYQKLFSSLNYEVEFMYILSDWFRAERYKDERDYIISVGCKYYFEYLPLVELGLPVPKS